MKRLLLIFILLPFFAIAQNCEYSKNEVDKFTKKSILRTEANKIWGNMFSSISSYGEKIDSTRYLCLWLVMGEAFSVGEGNDMIFLFDNDSTVILHNSESIVADYYNSGQASVWTARLHYYLDKINYNYLISSKITDFRIYFNDGYIENPIKPKYDTKLRKSLICIE